MDLLWTVQRSQWLNCLRMARDGSCPTLLVPKGPIFSSMTRIMTLGSSKNAGELGFPDKQDTTKSWVPSGV